MKKIGKYSMGLGDRFGHQGSAQLRAIMDAEKLGVEITPVWNKSNREHVTIGTEPSDVRKEADTVTREAGFRRDYFVDADHINADTVGRFIEPSDFFTVDVASFIGKPADNDLTDKFLKKASKYVGQLSVPGIPKPFVITDSFLAGVAEKYVFAASKAGEIYRKIADVKGKGKFVTEISMDEVAHPQTPAELFFILMLLSMEDIPMQTIAPKFSGRFNKGVDYVGNPESFALEFESDLLVIDKAVKEFGLMDNLKISAHSGSDKFAIYPYIGRIIRKHEKGLHLKTAGTTWLEEVIGLAMAGGEALEFVKEVYSKSLEKMDELCAPYADVIDIRKVNLPAASEIGSWSGEKFAASVRHNQADKNYNPDMRQLIHVAYKLAAMKMEKYYSLLEQHSTVVGSCVYENVMERHVKRVFLP